MLLSQIPGLQKAVARALEREEAMRILPFLPHAATLSGIPLRPLTPRHFTLLCAVRSPYVFGKKGEYDQALQFLWIVSPEYVQPSPQVGIPDVRKARKAWQRRIWPRLRKRKLKAVNQTIRAHLDQALFDAQKSSGKSDEPPIAHLCALLVDEFGEAYDWMPQTLDARGQPIPGGGTLDMPFAELLQYRRARHARKGEHIGTSHVDRVKLAHVRKYTAQQKKAAAKRNQKPATRNQKPGKAAS